MTHEETLSAGIVTRKLAAKAYSNMIYDAIMKVESMKKPKKTKGKNKRPC